MKEKTDAASDQLKVIPEALFAFRFDFARRLQRRRKRGNETAINKATETEPSRTAGVGA
jgi:hypothetical protein